MKGKDLTERVYRDFKRDVMLKKFPSNDLFSEQMLAERYDCSRTPAREAAGRLVAEGFLNKYPSKGYIVRLPTEREMAEMRYCCFVLENAALELSVHCAYGEEIRALYSLLDEKIDDPEVAYFSNMTFHYELTKLSGNNTILSMVERLHGLMIREESEPTYRGLTSLGETMPVEGPKQTFDKKEEKECQRKLVDALLARDLAEAKRQLYIDMYHEAANREGKALNRQSF